MSKISKREFLTEATITVENHMRQKGMVLDGFPSDLVTDEIKEILNVIYDALDYDDFYIGRRKIALD